MPRHRVERVGQPSEFTPRVFQFLEKALDGISLDQPENLRTKRPDWLCLQGSLVVEVKTLDRGRVERMQNLLSELKSREDWPTFFGEVKVSQAIKHLHDAEQVRGQLTDRAGRAIRNHLKTANEQLRAYCLTSEARPIFRLVVLINEDNRLYEPQLVRFVVEKALAQRTEGRTPLTDIDAVIFLTERHAVVSVHGPLMPVTSISRSDEIWTEWHEELLSKFLQRWAEWIGIPRYQFDSGADKVSTIEQVPESVTHSQLWKLEYHRDPYLSELTEAELFDHFDEVIVVQLLLLVKTSPVTGTEESQTTALEAFTHTLEELNLRGIPMERMPQDPQRLTEAAKRLELDTDVVNWIRALIEQ